MTDERYDGSPGQQGQHTNLASQQLQELFHRFDRERKGYLTLEDLELFCSSTMGMEKEKVPSMFAQLDQDEDGRVTFGDFSHHWQSVTQHSLLTPSSPPPRLLLSPDSDDGDGGDDCDGGENDDDRTEVAPKFVLNEKRFGRRSRPESNKKQTSSVRSEAHDQQQQDCGSPDLASQIGSIRSSSLLARFGLGDMCHSSPVIQRRTFSFDPETCGSPTQSRMIIKSLSATDSRDSVFEELGKDESVLWTPSSHYSCSSQSPTGDEMSMIKAIFDKYDIDDDGLINKQDLSDVCDSLRMSQTDEQLSELFEMLDEDKDGRVSFNDFCKKMIVVKETYELESPTSASQSLLFEVASSTPMTGHTQSRVATPALIGTSLLAKKSAIVEDLFHKLDTDNKGVVQRDGLISMWMDQSGDPHNEQHQQITRFLQGLETDENGHVSVEEVTFGMQAALMDDHYRDSRDPALRMYLTGIRHLRSRLVTVQLEFEKLQADFSALSEEKGRLVRLSDEEADQLRREHKQDRESDEVKFQEKTQQLERDHRYEQEMVEHQAQKQIRQLEEEIENMKLADENMKLKIRDLEEDKQLLEKDLQVYVDQTEEKDRLIEQLQRELDEQDAACSTHDLHGVLDDDEQDDTRELKEQISKLTKEIATLRDAFDERVAEIGLYKQQLLHERRKSQREGRRRRPSSGSASTVRRAGSKVGDYMKKRKESAGSTSADDTDGSRPKSRDDGVVVSPTPPPAIERTSADGDSSEDEEALLNQEDDEDDDEDLIAKYVARIKELESEKSHVEAGFQEMLDQKTTDLQQKNKKLIAENEELTVTNNKLSTEALSFQAMAEGTVSVNSELQGIVMERQELSIRVQHLEVKLANAQEANEGLRQQNNELNVKRQELLADRNQFLLDIDKLEKENHQIQLQHNTDMEEMQERLTKERDTTVSKLQEEADSFRSDIGRLRKEHDDELQRQREQFVEEKEEVRHQVAENYQLQLEKAHATVEEMRAEEEGLKLSARVLSEENHQLKQQHNLEMTETQDKLREQCQQVESLQNDLQILKAENAETIQKQKEQFDEEKKELELTLSEQIVTETTKVKHQVLEECKEQIDELQSSLEQSEAEKEELKSQVSALVQEKSLIEASLGETSVEWQQLKDHNTYLEQCLTEAKQQIVHITSENTTLCTQIEQETDTARDVQAQLRETKAHQDSLVKDRHHVMEQLNNTQETLSTTAQERDYWRLQVDTLKRTVRERDQSISKLEESSRQDVDKEAQLHDENTKLKADLREQSLYVINLETILGKYSAESTEQRLIEGAEMKQRLEQLEEDNKSLRRQLTPVKKQSLHRFTSPKTERDNEALRLENSALTRAVKASHQNLQQLQDKWQELNDQNKALLTLVQKVAQKACVL